MPSLEQLQQLLVADPKDPFVLYGIALEYVKLKDANKAAEYFDRCLASDPAYFYAYYHKAKVLADVGRPKDAAAVARTGLKAARTGGDAKAAGEIQALLDEIE